MSLNQNQLEKLKELSKKADVTLSMIMLTLYARTIAKWSQNKSFILNIPVFDRDPNIDIKNNVADFTNILLLDIDMRYSTTLTEDAKRIQKQFHRRMKYIDYSELKLLEIYKSSVESSFCLQLFFQVI